VNDSYQEGPGQMGYPGGGRYPQDDSYHGNQDDSFRGPMPQDDRYNLLLFYTSNVFIEYSEMELDKITKIYWA